MAAPVQKLAREATYELESLLLCLQKAINDIIESGGLTETLPAYAARGFVQRSITLNSALMCIACQDEQYIANSLLADVRGWAPKAVH